MSIATRSDEPRTPIIIMRRRRARGNEKNNKDRKNCGKSDYYPMYMIHYCCVSRGDTFVSSTRCFIASGSLGHVTRRTACRHQYCIILFGVSDTRLLLLLHYHHPGSSIKTPTGQVYDYFGQFQESRYKLMILHLVRKRWTFKNKLFTEYNYQTMHANL